MSLMPFFDFTQQQFRHKSDWDVVADMLRLVGLLPALREQIGQQRVRGLLEGLALLPPTEQAAFYQEQVLPTIQRYRLRGFPEALATPQVQPYAQYAGQMDPDVAARIRQSIDAAIEAHLPPGAPADAADRMRKAIEARIATLPVPGYTLPGRGFVASPEGQAQILQQIPSLAAQVVASTPIHAPGIDLLPEGPLKTFVRNDPLLSAVAMQPVNLMVPGAAQEVVTRLIASVEGNTQNILSTVRESVAVFAQNPSAEGAKHVFRQIEGARQLLSAVGPRAAFALDALQGIAEGVRNTVVQVPVMDPQTRQIRLVSRTPEQALEYQNRMTEYYVNSVVLPLVNQMTYGNPQQQQEASKKFTEKLQEAAKLGVDLAPLFNGALAQSRAVKDLELRKANAAIAASQAQAAESMARARLHGLTFQRESLMTQDLKHLRAKLLGGGQLTEGEVRTWLLYHDPRALASGGRELPSQLAYDLLVHPNYGARSKYESSRSSLTTTLSTNRREAGAQIPAYLADWGNLVVAYQRLARADADAARIEGRAGLREVLIGAVQPDRDLALVARLVREGLAPAWVLPDAARMYTLAVQDALELGVFSKREADALMGNLSRLVSPPAPAAPPPRRRIPNIRIQNILPPLEGRGPGAFSIPPTQRTDRNERERRTR